MDFNIFSPILEAKSRLVLQTVHLVLNVQSCTDFLEGDSTFSTKTTQMEAVSFLPV